MDISSVSEDNITKSKRFFPKTVRFNLMQVLVPFLFAKDLVGYLLMRCTQLYRFLSAFSVVLTTIFTRLKNWLVSKLFWGRGNLYKMFFRGGLIFVLVGWLYSSVWGGVGYADSLVADSTYILQQRDYEVEFGSSVSPIDEDRPRDSVQEYIVQGGDTLSTIAAKFDISVSTIKWSNGISSDYIKPGQTLKILPVTGVLHTVKSGDTLASVAKKYNASEQAIADVNWLDPPFNLQAGQNLMVPGGEIKAAPVVAASPTTGTSTGGNTTIPTSGTGKFLFPTTGYISQYSSRWHTAIDVASRAAPDVVAADAGKVVYSGWDSTGYGLTILIDHGNGFVTRYAHSSSLYVKTGEYVNRGQAIMRMGSTGRSTGTHLHFEIKYNGVKQNPMSYF